MPRLIIALLIAMYAIAFGFAAMAAIRWPSLMLIATFAFETSPDARLSEVNWRELGIVFSGPYLLAAICFYASSMMVSRVKKGGSLWFSMACIAGFPCVFMVDFEPGWWQNPSPGEGAVLGAAVGAVLLLIAVYNLRPTRRPTREKPVEVSDGPPVLVLEQPVPSPKPERKAPRRRQTQALVPPAIARQRAAFAAEGRRMLARKAGRTP